MSISGMDVAGGRRTSHAQHRLRTVATDVVVWRGLNAIANHTTTRISIQTAGLTFGGTGLCSCRVRGVDGSCAKHSTVESYIVIYAPNSYTYCY